MVKMVWRTFMIEVVDKLIEIAEVTESHDYDMQLIRIKGMLKKREYLGKPTRVDP